MAFRRGQGRGEERGDEGDRLAVWITTVPFSLSRSLPKMGDYRLYEQRGW